ncbi:MAG: Glycolate dehydrogenase, subunit GlcD [uncultured Chloroflexi bacterium]|uniref:Glycolate dehydrogenase, subunit GlcD n=1 Tax=uncultured Chloroflexota bacterium TaxID=166587 RepID=A0A6J4JVF6_9CHLR|nr:MAG: Glycolate dehydrogenase, subunit GlcD [uncultured Chloroflexota bacterium]
MAVLPWLRRRTEVVESVPPLVAGLQAIAGKEHVLWRSDELRSYEYDGSIDVGHPDAVVLVGNRDEVVEVVKLARRFGKPIVPRGAGTGLSGGAVLSQGGIAVGFSRMRRILDIDVANQRATCEPGVVNLDLSKAAAPHGLYYAPDPSSQAACSLGGNVAENSGGAHCLAYGVTTNHVLGLEMVLSDGRVVSSGGAVADSPGYDLTGLAVGSEGTFAIVTKIVVRLMPVQERVRTLLALYDTVDAASATTSAIVAAGIIPAALEMMDGLTIEALRRAGHQGLPEDAQAVLLVELEGLQEGLDELVTQVEGICTQNGAREIRTAKNAEERDRLWKARKGALGALGQIKPNYYLQDGVIPRTRLIEVLRTVDEVSRKYDIPIANVFHAGDGNLHPCLVFDQRIPGDTQKVVAAGADILRKCVEVGGTLSGEHGVGLEKQAYMSWVFSEQDFDAMHRLKRAFDPDERLNPGKIFPTPDQVAAATKMWHDAAGT